MSNHLIVSAAVSACLAVSTGALATEQDSETLETVTISARRVQPLALAIGNVSVIRAEELAAAFANDLREVAAFEPGLSARNEPGRFGLESIAIRGIGGNRVAIELDGVPIGKSYAVGSFASAGRSLPDFALLERLEILRGPASALYGSDALGGVVSASTWRPRQWLSRTSEPSALSTRAGIDSLDESYSAGVQGAAAGERIAVLVGLEHRSGRERELAGASEANPRSYDSDSATLRASVGTGDTPLEFGLSFDRLRQETDLVALRGLPGRFATTTSVLGDDSSRRVSAFVAKSFGAADHALGEVTLRGYFLRNDTLQATYEQRRAAPPRQPSALAIEREFALRQYISGIDASIAREFAAAGFEHRIVWGLDANRGRVREQRDGQQRALASGAVTQTILGEVFPLRDFPITDTSETGAFVENELTRPGARWTLRLGARYDDYRLDPRTDDVWVADNPTLPAVSVRHHAWSPRVGATWEIASQVRVFGQYSHGFRSPPFEDVNIGLDLPSVGVRALPNPQLRPEKSDGFELGLRMQRDGLWGTISAFDTRYRNLIDSRVNLGRDPVSGLTLFQSQNRARARIYGAEANLRGELGEWLPALEGWTARLGGSWLRGVDTSRDVPLNTVDPAKFTLGLRYRAAPDLPAIEARLTSVGGKRDVEQPTTGAPLYVTGGFATLDLLGEIKLGARGTLRVSLSNVFDRHYAEWADVRGRTIDDPLLPFYFSGGRSFALGLDWRF
jgi:hemoglobin/transferrin/lactoferrin receptor protein